DGVTASFSQVSARRHGPRRTRISRIAPLDRSRKSLHALAPATNQTEAGERRAENRQAGRLRHPRRDQANIGVHSLRDVAVAWAGAPDITPRAGQAIEREDKGSR